MKRLFFILAFSFLQIGLFSQIDVKNEFPLTYAKIKQQAAIKWPDDYNMQKYQIETQCQAFNEFYNLESEYKVPENVFDKITTKAINKWSKNTISKCYDETHGTYNLDLIYSCPDSDWQMVVYESKQQLDAYISLNQ